MVEGAKIAGASRIIGVDRLESKLEKGTPHSSLIQAVALPALPYWTRFVLHELACFVIT